MVRRFFYVAVCVHFENALKPESVCVVGLLNAELRRRDLKYGRHRGEGRNQEGRRERERLI